MNKSFEVIRRNSGHWDIYQDGARIAKIRGGPHIIQLITDPKGIDIFWQKLIEFPSVESCMSYICAALMKE